MNNDIRNLSKWLNEEQETPIDRQALARVLAMAEQPAQQEPVAWMHEWEDGERIPMLTGRDDRNNDQPKSVRPLVYGDTPQAQPARKPLTREQVKDLLFEAGYVGAEESADFISGLRHGEAAHGIKEQP